MIGIVLLAVLGQTEGGFGGEEVAPGAEVAAEAREVAEQEKQAMRRRVAEDRVKSQFLRGEESSILRAIAELDRDLETQKKRLSEVEKKKQKVQLEMAHVEESVAGAEERLGALRDQIGRRAAAMVRLKRTAVAELLARAGSPIELRKLRDRLRLVLAYDQELIVRLTGESKDAGRLRQELGERRTALDQAGADLVKERESGLLLREERAALLSSVQAERKMIERLAGEIAVAARKLESELDVVRGAGPAPAAAAGGFGRQKGRLPWPVAGRVEVPFGKRVDPESGAVMAHKGIDVRAAADDPVRAVFGGKVVYAAEMEGFGKLMVLAHGEGWFSVYAHLDRFEVPAGAEVAQHQAIGSVGETGSTKGPYLYLELRNGKDAVDPLQWLAR